MIKIAVVGSRGFKDYHLLENILLAHIPCILISGGAIGADKLVEKFATYWNQKIEVILPNWEKYGKSAGPIRNKEIINKADHLIAFWNGKSRGTFSSINFAKNKKIRVDIVKYLEGTIEEYYPSTTLFKRVG